MKFNEKLIQLRKKEGLSQEELGYKLNVTRQTVITPSASMVLPADSARHKGDRYIFLQGIWP